VPVITNNTATLARFLIHSASVSYTRLSFYICLPPLRTPMSLAFPSPKTNGISYPFECTPEVSRCIVLGRGNEYTGLNQSEAAIGWFLLDVCGSQGYAFLLCRCGLGLCRQLRGPCASNTLTLYFNTLRELFCSGVGLL
jgi:hypothetical protein